MSLKKPFSFFSFFFFRVKNIREVKNICAQTVFSVAHTEHAPPLVKAHTQRPTNTYCTLSHTQTKPSETHTAPGVQLPLCFFIFTPVFCQQSDTQRSQDGRKYAAVDGSVHFTSLVIVHTCNC